MDYYKIYTTDYERIYRELENNIKNDLIAYKKTKKNFTFAHNAISRKIYNLIDLNTISTNNILKELFFYFKTCRADYTENYTQLSLENETLVKFNTIGKESLPPDYTFETFTKDLAIYRSYTEIDRLFSNNRELFKMMFLLDDFSEFKIETYESTALENSKLYIKLHEKLYKFNKVSIEEVNIIKSPVKIEMNKNTSEIEKNFNFSENEKEVLFFALYKILDEGSINGKQIKLEFTEYYKIISIVNLNDISSLSSNNYKNSSKYRVLTNGIEHICNDIQSQSNLIDILIVKTKKAKLRTMTKYLSNISNNLLAEIARIKKNNKK